MALISNKEADSVVISDEILENFGSGILQDHDT
jgi:hypothetical protein